MRAKYRSCRARSRLILIGWLGAPDVDHSSIASSRFEFFVTLAPQLEFAYLCLREVGSALQIELDNAGTEVGAANIDECNEILQFLHASLLIGAPPPET